MNRRSAASVRTMPEAIRGEGAAPTSLIKGLEPMSSPEIRDK